MPAKHEEAELEPEKEEVIEELEAIKI